MWIGLAIAALIALAIGGLAFAMSGGKDVEVPDVTNETKAAASQALQSAGLKVDSETKKIPDDKIEEGKVVKTDPEAKSSVKKRPICYFIYQLWNRKKLRWPIIQTNRMNLLSKP